MGHNNTSTHPRDHARNPINHHAMPQHTYSTTTHPHHHAHHSTVSLTAHPPLIARVSTAHHRRRPTLPPAPNTTRPKDHRIRAWLGSHTADKNPAGTPHTSPYRSRPRARRTWGTWSTPAARNHGALALESHSGTTSTPAI